MLLAPQITGNLAVCSMQEVFPGYDFIRNNIAHIDGSVQDYGILFASALEILQSYAESWISYYRVLS